MQQHRAELKRSVDSDDVTAQPYNRLGHARKLGDSAVSHYIAVLETFGRLKKGAAGVAMSQ